MNTSAPFMLDTTQASVVKKQRADLYARIYQYAAEDFITQADFAAFLRALKVYNDTVESQLDTLMSVIASHTHVVTSHAEGQPSQALPTPTVIKWTNVPDPLYINTTLTAPNMGGNYVIMAPGEDGDSIPELRRAMMIPAAVAPVVPPMLSVKLL